MSCGSTRWVCTGFIGTRQNSCFVAAVSSRSERSAPGGPEIMEELVHDPSADKSPAEHSSTGTRRKVVSAPVMGTSSDPSPLTAESQTPKEEAS